MARRPFQPPDRERVLMHVHPLARTQVHDLLFQHPRLGNGKGVGYSEFLRMAVAQFERGGFPHLTPEEMGEPEADRG